MAKVHRRIPLDNSASGYARRGGVIELNRVAASPRRVAPIHQGPLRRCVYLTVRTVQGGEKEQSAIETLGVSNRGDGDINRRAGAGKRRKCGGDENRSEEH